MAKATIIAVAGKGGVGKTSLAANIVRNLVEAYPDKRILAIDADPAVGLSTGRARLSCSTRRVSVFLTLWLKKTDTFLLP